MHENNNAGFTSEYAVSITLAYQQFVLLMLNSPQTLRAISKRHPQPPRAARSSFEHDQHVCVPKDQVALTKNVPVQLRELKLSGSTIHTS